MKRVGFDERCGALTIMGGESYFPHSLMAEADGVGMIRVTSCAGRVELYVPWTEIADLAGDGFASADAALAYLQGEFAKRPAPPDLISPYAAAADLGGHRVVRAVTGGVDLASSDDPDGACDVIGLTTAAAAAGASVSVVTHGPVTEPSWSFAIGPVYLGRDGLLTQDSPATGCVLRVGRATAPTVLLVDLDEPYFLAA